MKALICWGVGLAVMMMLVAPAGVQAARSASLQAAAAPAKLPPIAHGTAPLGILSTSTKVVKGEVISTIEVKNTGTEAIAGLVARLYWYDKSGSPIAGAGDEQRLRKPFLPNETHIFEFKVPKAPQMASNQFQFSHANGGIEAKRLTPEKPAVKAKRKK